MQPHTTTSLSKAQSKYNCAPMVTLSPLQKHQQHLNKYDYRYNVLIIERVLPHYRLAFFRCLQNELSKRSIKLTLIYGQEYPGAVPVMVPLHEPWAHQITNRYFPLIDPQLVWQPCGELLNNMDLIIIEQANRLLINYVLHIRRLFYKQKIAFFGHGKNLQASKADSWKEWIKSRFINHVDWWFAYTEMSSDIVLNSGFPRDRLTIVQNAIDTTTLADQISQQNPQEVTEIKKSLGITTDNIAIFCGGMYPDKKIDFLLTACQKIKQLVPDFHVLFVGNGPLQSQIALAAQQYSWLHYIGPKFGEARVPYLMMSKVMLMPGLVGLVILDSFTAELPLFTTNVPIHSPEIAYLDNGINGVITDPNIEEYAQAVSQYLTSPELQKKLKEGCRKSSQYYSIEAMVDNFANGIDLCLKS